MSDTVDLTRTEADLLMEIFDQTLAEDAPAYDRLLGRVRALDAGLADALTLATAQRCARLLQAGLRAGMQYQARWLLQEGQRLAAAQPRRWPWARPT
jgi:hypothetical protein